MEGNKEVINGTPYIQQRIESQNGRIQFKWIPQTNSFASGLHITPEQPEQSHFDFYKKGKKANYPPEPVEPEQFPTSEIQTPSGTFLKVHSW